MQFGTFGLAATLLGIGIFLRSINRRRNQGTQVAWWMILPSTTWCCLCVAGWLFFGFGPVVSRQSWPRELKRMMDVSNFNPQSVRVSGLGAFIDSEHVWRIKVDRKIVQQLETEFGMTQTKYESVPSAFWRVFPGWWRPLPVKGMVYMETPNFPAWQRGPDGSHFLAAYDASTEQLYVWHKFNF